MIIIDNIKHILQTRVIGGSYPRFRFHTTPTTPLLLLQLIAHGTRWSSISYGYKDGDFEDFDKTMAKPTESASPAEIIAEIDCKEETAFTKYSSRWNAKSILHDQIEEDNRKINTDSMRAPSHLVRSQVRS